MELTFPNGDYRIRAKANCGTGGITYSSEKKGIIDRNSLAPFGIPSPGDGYLRTGQEISVTFDKEIECNFTPNYQPIITLTRLDNGEAIPVIGSCFGNKLILNTSPHLTEIPELEGVEVLARVEGLQDLSGNVQEYPTVWSFLVNVNPVFWDPESIYEEGQQGIAHTIKGTIKNSSSITKEFSLATVDAPDIIYIPEWLIPVQTRGTVLPSGEYMVDFNVSSDLQPGIYTDSIIAMVDDLPMGMEVTFELLARPVNWTFDASKYEYSMTMVSQFSLDQTDNNLSSDDRDMIAAYVDGEIRGITNIEYLPGPDLYRAFLTIYSNVAGGGGAEDITFRFWKAGSGLQYGAVESIEFASDSKVGDILTPFILHPRGTFQVIPLKVGWNWISLNSMTVDMSREAVFQSIMKTEGPNTITIKSDDNKTSEFNSNTGWQGNLTELEVAEGYLLHLSDEPDTLYHVGEAVLVPYTKDVVSGWNWIGHIGQEPTLVDSVLQDLTPISGDILKSQSTFAEYLDHVNGWEGNLSFFEPGFGYKLKLGNGGSITYRDGDYKVQTHDWEFNMNITAHIDPAIIKNMPIEQVQIGAFIDGQCRGFAEIDQIEILNDHRVFLLVHGNSNDIDLEIELRLFNTLTGKEYISNKRVSFIPDRLLGSVLLPYHIEFGEKTEYRFENNLRMSPNPTNGILNVGFQLQKVENVSMRLLSV